MPDSVNDRIAALELIAIQFGAQLPSGKLEAAIKAIAAEPDQDGQPAAGKATALALLAASLKQWDELMPGVFVPKDD